MAGGPGFLEATCIVLVGISAVYIVLNWLALLAVMFIRREGTFSFFPPVFGVLGAIGSIGAFDNHALWIALGFLLLEPSTLALTAYSIQKFRNRSKP
jgi:hypothetical protein